MKEVDHKKDRKLLLKLCRALSISRNNIKKDELGYWNIVGKRGKIDTDGEWWYLHIQTGKPRIWHNVKKSLPGMVVAIDGDLEGVLKQESMPDVISSQQIRSTIGVRWAKKPTPEETEKLISRLREIKEKK